MTKAKMKKPSEPHTYKPLEPIKDLLWKIKVMFLRKNPTVISSGIGINIVEATYFLDWFDYRYVNEPMNVSTEEKTLADKLINFISSEIEVGRLVIPKDLIGKKGTKRGKHPAPENWWDVHKCCDCKEDFEPANLIEARSSRCRKCLKAKCYGDKVKEFEVEVAA